MRPEQGNPKTSLKIKVRVLFSLSGSMDTILE